MTFEKKEVRRVVVVGDHVEVPLPNGRTAVVDIGDLALVAGRNWHSSNNKHTSYAATHVKLEGGGWGKVTLHRWITGFDFVDHIDGDGLNNRRSNLRRATVAQNNKNRRIRSDNTSGYKGVYRHNGAWRAEITTDGTRNVLGSFDNLEDAAAAYANASSELHGEFGRTS